MGRTAAGRNPQHFTVRMLVTQNQREANNGDQVLLKQWGEGRMRRVAGLRSRWPRWQVTATAVGVIIAGGAAAVAKWPHAWWWLAVVTAAAAALAPPALAAASQASQRRREDARAARAG